MEVRGASSKADVLGGAQSGALVTASAMALGASRRQHHGPHHGVRFHPLTTLMELAAFFGVLGLTSFAELRGSHIRPAQTQ